MRKWIPKDRWKRGRGREGRRKKKPAVSCPCLSLSHTLGSLPSPGGLGVPLAYCNFLCTPLCAFPTREGLCEDRRRSAHSPFICSSQHSAWHSLTIGGWRGKSKERSGGRGCMKGQGEELVVSCKSSQRFLPLASWAKGNKYAVDLSNKHRASASG